jgi:hypothetical protein
MNVDLSRRYSGSEIEDIIRERDLDGRFLYIENSYNRGKIRYRCTGKDFRGSQCTYPATQLGGFCIRHTPRIKPMSTAAVIGKELTDEDQDLLEELQDQPLEMKAKQILDFAIVKIATSERINKEQGSPIIRQLIAVIDDELREGNILFPTAKALKDAIYNRNMANTCNLLKNITALISANKDFDELTFIRESYGPLLDLMIKVYNIWADDGNPKAQSEILQRMETYLYDYEKTMREVCAKFNIDPTSDVMLNNYPVHKPKLENKDCNKDIVIGERPVNPVPHDVIKEEE